MFLYMLNQKEKVAFLQIAHHLAASDGVITEAEKSVIKQYCIEMQIDDLEEDEKALDLPKILSKITNPQSQKIVLLETMAMFMADSLRRLDELEQHEKDILDEMTRTFGLTHELARVYANWTKAILALSLQGEYLIRL